MTPARDRKQGSIGFQIGKIGFSILLYFLFGEFLHLHFLLFDACFGLPDLFRIDPDRFSYLFTIFNVLIR